MTFKEKVGTLLAIAMLLTLMFVGFLLLFGIVNGLMYDLTARQAFTLDWPDYDRGFFWGSYFMGAWRITTTIWDNAKEDFIKEKGGLLNG